MNASLRPVGILVGLMLLTAVTAQAQARLTIVNQSQREMHVKVMRVGDTEDTLHARLAIPQMSSRTISFSGAGLYFTKTMAVLSGRNTIYQQGRPFEVYVGSGGYSILTLTFTIVESMVPQFSDGRAISQDEFEQDITRHR